MTNAIAFNEQINRDALFWLLFTQVALVLPHLEGLPLWLFVICALCGGWRYGIYRQALNYPGSLVRSCIVVLGFVLVAVEYLGKFSLDPAVALLVLAFFLKILETRRQRDVYVVVCLGFFVAATRLLYSQSIYATLYALFCCMLLLVTLLALHQTEATDYRSAFKRAGGLMLKAVPLLVVLFMFFPRVPPLWSVPLPAGQGITGVNDRLSPGAMTRLAKSDVTAFRVEFNGAIPPKEEQYWRGLVFDSFDGKEWREHKARNIADDKRVIDEQQPSYEITMQPSYQHWLFTLADSTIAKQGVVRRTNGTLASIKPLKSREKYLAKILAAPSNPQLTLKQYQQNIQLPNNNNEQTKSFANNLRAEYSDDYTLAQAVLQHFNENDFFYTLKPKALGANSIDEFMFSSREGYCEHYATAFVFVMRAAGIPARAVGGYQGGEINPFDDYLRVRELDAHAWAEIWLQGKGWVRIDPTAAVAPERIQNGVESALRARNEFEPTGLHGWSNAAGLQWLRTVQLWMDSINHEWTRRFLNYNQQEQSDWLKSWWGKASVEELLRLLIAFVGGVLFIFFLWTVVINKWLAMSLLGFIEHQYSGMLRRKNIDVDNTDTVQGMTSRAQLLYPTLSHQLADFSAWHSDLVYKEASQVNMGQGIKLLFMLNLRLTFARAKA